MSSTPAFQIEAAARPRIWAALRTAVPDLCALTKPEVNFLIVIATFTGFDLGWAGDSHNLPFGRLFNALCGTLLVASGTGTLNQYLEYRFDAQMRRTRGRPVAAGRLHPRTAAWFGIALSITGMAYLFFAVNALASLLAVFTLTTYLFIYTPLKRKTPLCTLAGAVSGAMPPLIGWAAAAGSIASGNAWILYSVLFLWQIPHVMAIAWLYRDDYARAGYFVLPRNDESGFMAWMAGVSSIALLLASAAGAAANGGGMFEYSATVLLALGLLYYAARQIILRSRIAARQLLKATIICLPLQYLILVLGKG